MLEQGRRERQCKWWWEGARGCCGGRWRDGWRWDGGREALTQCRGVFVIVQCWVEEFNPR